MVMIIITTATLMSCTELVLMLKGNNRWHLNKLYEFMRKNEFANVFA